MINMKKTNFFGWLGILVAIMVANGFTATTSFKSSELDVTDIETEAKVEWNPFRLWFTQGFTADERDMTSPCPNAKRQSGCFYPEQDDYDSNSCDYNYSYYGVNCVSGNINCCKIECQ